MLLSLSRALGFLSLAALRVSAVCLVLMTAFVAWQVWGRFVLNASPNWTEAGSVLLMSWFTFLGAAVGAREGFHLSFDVLAHALPPRGRAVLAGITDLVVLAFGIGMAWFGAQLAASAWSSTLPSLGFPGGVTYLPLVAGGALVTLFSAERLVARLAGAERAGLPAAGH